MLADLKRFLMRGNVVDLAVAVVIGVAFGAVVTAFVDHVINPIIAAMFGTALFFVVQAFNRLQSMRRTTDPEEAPVPSDDIVLLTEIRDLLRARG